ncbi:MAG: hypothetical protein Q8L52_03690 [bacterium]|nr:hypothetical protein [bacterium]
MHTFRNVGIIGAVALLFSASVAFAEAKPAVTTQREGVRTAEVRAEVRSEGARAATPTRGESEQVRARVASTSQERIQVIRDEAQVRVKAVKEKATQKLADIQDKQRQQQAQKIATRFDNLNTTWTNNFAQLLDRYGVIVQKMEARSVIAAAAGKDVTAANAAIQAAVTSIATAQAAVVAQAAKTYVPDTSTVSVTTAVTTAKGQEDLMRGLKTSFQNLHSTLFKDLFALRDGPMTSARKAVQNALQALGKVPGVDESVATPIGSNR